MQNATVTAGPVPRTDASTASPRLTRALLAGGVAAGPIYVAVGLLEMAIRPGFDIRRHELSLMSNGDLGWIQIANFIVTGLLVIGCAAGLRRALGGQRGGTWGPVLLGLYGLGLIGAGLFVADPMNGFPAGAPAGMPRTMSAHSLMHLVSGSLGFAGLIAACMVFARRCVGLGRRRWAAYSAATGIIFLVSFIGIASGARLAAINIAFSVAVVLGWAWVTAVSADVRSSQR